MILYLVFVIFKNCLLCNATIYFRHTEEMIKKLEAAGLGYYVKSDSTQQKFGMQAILWLIVMCYYM